MNSGIGLGASGILTGLAMLKVLPKGHVFHFMIIVGAISLVLGLIVFSTSSIMLYRKKDE